MPNRDDDGTLNASVTGGRLVTGLVVTGTAANPVIYVGVERPAHRGGEGGGDLDLDTNSGIVSKLTKPGSTWVKQDLVRGPSALRGEPHDQRPRAQPRRQHALRRPGRQHEQGRAVEQLRGPARVRAVGGDPLDRPAGHRQHDLRPAHARRPDEPGRRRERPVRRQRRPEPGAARAGRAGAGLRAGLPQPVRHRDHRVGPDVQHRQRRQRGLGRHAAAGQRRRARARTRSRSRDCPTATPCTGSPGRATTAAIRTRRAPTSRTRSAARRRSTGRPTPSSATSGRPAQPTGPGTSPERWPRSAARPTASRSTPPRTSAARWRATCSRPGYLDNIYRIQLTSNTDGDGRRRLCRTPGLAAARST